MNVENGHQKMHIIEAETNEQAIAIIEADDYDKDAPYGWEVLHYEYDDYHN
jgi:hypothetical protein